MPVRVERARLVRSIEKARGWLERVDTGGSDELRALRQLGIVFAGQALADDGERRPSGPVGTVSRSWDELLTATREEWDPLATSLAFEPLRLASDGVRRDVVQQLLVAVAAAFAVDGDISLASRLLRAARFSGDRTAAIGFVEDCLLGCQFADGHFGLLPSAVAEVGGASGGPPPSDIRLTVEVLSALAA